MRFRRSVVGVVASVGVSGSVLAQQVVPCPTSPGAAFGITGYRCASCGVERGPDGTTIYAFQSEPVVTQVDSTSQFRVDDVIEAINGKPVTTREGTALFARPLEGNDSSHHLRPGDSLLFVWRGDHSSVEAPRTVLQDGTVRVAMTLGPPPFLVAGLTLAEVRTEARRRERSAGPGADPVDVIDLQGSARVDLRRNGKSIWLRIFAKPPCRAPSPAPVGVPAPGYVRRHMILDPAVAFESSPNGGPLVEIVQAGPDRARFGLAVECVPAAVCTAARAADGSAYTRFSTAPTIAGVRDSSAAAEAGLRTGDVLIAVDGQSILSDDGALAFERATTKGKGSIRISVIRDGKQLDLTLIARK